MGTVGAALKEFIARKATLSIDGEIMAAGKNWHPSYGYVVTKEPVCGSHIQRYAHAEFDGQITCECLLVSDENWTTISKVLDTTYTLISTDVDTQGSPASTAETCTIKIFRRDRVGPANATGFIRCRIQAEITAVPT